MTTSDPSGAATAGVTASSGVRIREAPPTAATPPLRRAVDLRGDRLTIAPSPAKAGPEGARDVGRTGGVGPVIMWHRPRSRQRLTDRDTHCFPGRHPPVTLSPAHAGRERRAITALVRNHTPCTPSRPSPLRCAAAH